MRTNILRSMWKAIKNSLAPYHVCVVWESKVYRHYAHTSSEALDWMGCYPATSKAYIQAHSAIPFSAPRIVASRGA